MSDVEIPPPRANPELVGHEAAERDLRRLFETGRLPHALLLSGPRGIGKATLAFRLARFVLTPQTGGLFGDAPVAGEGLWTDPESGVFRRIAAAGHADLLTVERAYDPRRKRMRSEIVVADTREIGIFLHLTPAEGGWRVVIVDGADAMNRNAANALLKILEEPPRRTLLLLVAHSAGRLLPTIRSRCRRFPLAPLAPEIVRDLLARHRPDLAAKDADAIVALAGGSIGAALDLATAGGIELYRAALGLIRPARELDLGALHAFADRLSRPDAEDTYRLVEDLLGQFLARLAVATARGESLAGDEGEAHRRLHAPASRWAQLRDDLAHRFARADGLNLDRKQAILGAFFAIGEAAG
ncbi:MAG TPA: DNA polymerase III subunit delta' [Stellaceae bacterium]|jgi:DNA polymerase-3 subunit delta'|nr:DNA polymerase III subunit delta' [Stellaceae bacterium]